MNRLQYKTYNKSYVGQSGSSVELRHREHVRCMKTKPYSAHALHILNNRHEYGSPEHTIQLLGAYDKGKIMNCWESFYMQVIQQQNVLIDEKTNPLYATANTTEHVTQLDTHSDSERTGPARRQHHHKGESVIK
jgi:hypothetical protein